jgi:HSP20 family protein
MPTLTKRSPFPPFTVADDADPVNRLFRRMFSEPMGATASSMLWTPSVEVADTPEALVLTAELPGLSERDLTLTLDQNLLTIAGEKKSEREVKKDDERYLLTERYYGSFQRAFTLPASVDAERISAVFDKGVLTVTLPKTAQAKGRVIDVTAKS